MLDYINRLLKNLSIKNQGNSVHVSGLPTYTFAADLQRIWGTQRIIKHMFSNISSSGLTMLNFFLPDLIYMLGRMRQESGMRTSKRLIIRLTELLLEETWMKSTTVANPSILNFKKLENFNVKPFPYQMDFLNTYNTTVPAYRLQGYVLAAGAGAGKTLNFLMLAHCLEADTIIAVAPKNTMRAAWEKDLTKHVKDDKIKDAYWSDDDKVQDITRSDKYFFLHYEAIDQLVDVMKHRKRASKRVVIAVDESHNLNDLSAARTRKLVEYVKLMRQNMIEVHVVFMSGTPIKQMGAEMIPCLNCIDPMFDRYAEERFRAIYGLTSSRANDILRARIGNMMHIVPREAYRKEKVQPIDVPVKIPNGKNYTLNSIRDLMAIYVSDRAKYYKDNMASFIATYEEGLRLYAATMRTPGERADFEKYKSFVAIIRKRYDPVAHKEMAMYCNAFEERRIMPVLPRDLKYRFKDAKSVVKYVALKIQGEALANVLGVARIRCHVDMLAHIDFDTYIDGAEGKTLIFSSYVPVVEKLTEMLSSAGFKPEPIYGATNKNINAILQRLEKDPDVNPAVATYDSLAEGVPMLMCNTELLLNAPWRSSDEIQAISRIDRVGQTLPVAVFRFYLDTGDEPNVSTRSQEIMELSRALVAEILGIEDSPKGAEATQMVLAMEGYSFEDELPQALVEEAFDAVPSTKSSYSDW